MHTKLVGNYFGNYPIFIALLNCCNFSALPLLSFLMPMRSQCINNFALAIFERPLALPILIKNVVFVPRQNCQQYFEYLNGIIAFFLYPSKIEHGKIREYRTNSVQLHVIGTRRRLCVFLGCDRMISRVVIEELI